jgi:hypothetical protein
MESSFFSQDSSSEVSILEVFPMYVLQPLVDQQLKPSKTMVFEPIGSLAVNQVALSL